MKLFEYQAKSFLSRFGLPYPPYFLLSERDDLSSLYAKYGLTKGTLEIEWIDEEGQNGAESTHYDSLESFQKSAAPLFQMKQEKENLFFSEVLVKPFVDIDKELFLSISCSLKTGDIVIEMSTSYLGEMRVVKATVLREKKVYDFQKNELFVALHLPENLRSSFYSIIDGLLACYYALDLKTLHVKPLAVLYSGGFALSYVEFEVDENSFFRQPDIKYFFAKGQLPKSIYDVRQLGFTYQEFPGSIGTIVTGQALLQATVDLLYVYRGNPGLAINIGEEIESKKLLRAMEALLQDKRIRVLCLNLFCGFTDAVPILEELIRFLKKQSSAPPIVLRLSALSMTRVSDLISRSHLVIRCTESLEEAIRWSISHQGGEHHAHSSR